MNKAAIYHKLLDQLATEFEAVAQAARHTIETATHEEFQAKSKYDTFSLEQSYLARGQAQRVEEIAETLAQLRAFVLPAITPGAPAQIGGLVELRAPLDEAEYFLLLPAGGGEEVFVDHRTVTVLTPQSPLGRSLCGKSVGDTVSKPGRASDPCRVLAIH